MRVKEGLSSIAASIDNNVSTSPGFRFQIGKVFGVIQNETTPNAQLFKANGGWDGLGTIFFLDYDNARNIDSIDLSKCKIAKPYFSNTKHYPLIGELVVLFDLPAFSSQIYQNNTQTYYLSTINLWGNNHHNSQPSGDTIRLGKSFDENSNINTLYPFEGDYIIESRFGSGLRFGSTTTLYNNVNQWSVSGKNGSPITILANGYNFDSSSLKPYIEDINSDKSSLYLTSTQQIPIIYDASNYNKITSPIVLEKYTNSQSILVGNRIVINSNKDEVFIVSKTNIELQTKNITNINSGERIHLNSPKTFLGANSDGTLPTEPILLGNQTVLLLNSLIVEISKLSSVLGTAISSAEGVPLADINVAGQQCSTKMQTLLKNLQNISSTSSYTI